MNVLLILAPILAACIVGVAVMRKCDQKHPSNGKDVKRTLTNHS